MVLCHLSLSDKMINLCPVKPTHQLTTPQKLVYGVKMDSQSCLLLSPVSYFYHKKDDSVTRSSTQSQTLEGIAIRQKYGDKECLHHWWLKSQPSTTYQYSLWTELWWRHISRITHLMICEFHILEVNPWTWTPILVNIGTFSIPLSTYILIKTHIKGVPILSLDKDTSIRICYIKFFIIVVEILVQ